MSLAIPLAVHGDAIPIIAIGRPNTQSLDVTSMQGILSRGNVAEVKHLLYSCFEKCKTEESQSVAGRKMKWSFEALASAYHPTHDDLGNEYQPGSAEHALALDENGERRPLAEGFFGIIYLVKGDLDHYAKWGLPDYRTNTPCNYCPADRGDRGDFIYY